MLCQVKLRQSSHLWHQSIRLPLPNILHRYSCHQKCQPSCKLESEFQISPKSSSIHAEQYNKVNRVTKFENILELLTIHRLNLFLSSHSASFSAPKHVIRANMPQRSIPKLLIRQLTTYEHQSVYKLHSNKLISNTRLNPTTSTTATYCVQSTTSRVRTDTNSDDSSRGRLRRKVSSLYIPRHRCTQVFAALVPYMEHYDVMLSDVIALSAELQLRQGPMDGNTEHHLLYLRQQWQYFKQIREEVENIDTDIYKVTKQLKALDNGSLDTNEVSEVIHGVCISNLNKKELKELVKKINKILKTVVIPLKPLEDDIIPQLLELPNNISPNTPLHRDKVEISMYPLPSFSFSPLSHVELGKATKTLELSNTSPGSYYLLGEMAVAELALQDYVADILMKRHFLQHANPDFAKGVTVEACFGVPNDDSNLSQSPQFGAALRLVRNAAEQELAPLFLVGGASLPSYLGYYARRIVSNVAKFMPQKLYAIGRLYNPRPIGGISTNDVTSDDIDVGANKEAGTLDERSGIYSSMQTTAVSCLLLYTKEDFIEADVINEILGMVSSVYNGLGLHYRVVNMRPSLLRSHEKQAYSIQMVTTSPVYISDSNVVCDAFNIKERLTDATTECPSHYTEVGRVSVCGDYISRRLLMAYVSDDDDNNKRQQQHKFQECVYCELVNVSKVLAVMMENTQTPSGKCVVPDCLKRRMMTYTDAQM